MIDFIASWKWYVVVAAACVTLVCYFFLGPDNAIEEKFLEPIVEEITHEKTDLTPWNGDPDNETK